MTDRESARVAVVLAGGAGRRIGGAKATVELRGRPLIRWALDAAHAAGLRAVVVAKPGSPLPPELGCEVLREPAEPVHPLVGVIAALEALGEPIVSCPCDAPFVPGPLLGWLAEQPEPLVTVRAGGRLHPHLARYAPRLVGRLREALARSAPLGETLTGLGARIVEEDELRAFGDPPRMLRNLNTPDDLAIAERELEGATRDDQADS